MRASTSTTVTPTASARPGGYRGDLILFLAITFGLSWAAWSIAAGLGGSAMSPPTAAPYMFGAFGPLIGALVVRIRRRKRGEPVPAHVVRFRRATLLWAPVLLVLASATVLGATLLATVAGGPSVSLDDAKDVMEDMGGPAAFLVSMIVSGPLSEEAGWRGTAYPRMRATMGRLQVGVVIGVIWAVWHLPLFFINDTVQNDLGLATPGGVLFAASTIPMAMLTAYAYERAGVVASMAVHFAVNTTMILVSVKAPETQAMIMGIQAIVAVLLVLTHQPAPKPGPSAAPAAPGAPGGAPLTAAGSHPDPRSDSAIRI